MMPLGRMIHDPLTHAATMPPSETKGFVEREIKKEEIPILNIGENVEAPPARELIEMESSFDNIENDLKEVIASGDALRKTFLELTEMRHVLHKTQQFFDQVHAHSLRGSSIHAGQVIAHLISYPFCRHSIIRAPCDSRCESNASCWPCVRREMR